MTSKKDKLKQAAFLAGAAGMSLLFGFSATLVLVKKQDPAYFDKGLVGGHKSPHGTGGGLALRALGWGTLIATSGVGLFCFGVWKISGASSMKEFQEKCSTTLPNLPKKENPGRNEFANLRELADYIENDGEKGEKKS